jgi:hypothetical protein
LPQRYVWGAENRPSYSANPRTDNCYSDYAQRNAAELVDLLNGDDAAPD